MNSQPIAVVDREYEPKQSSAFAFLLERIKSRTAKVAVIGLGYVGLPLVRALVTAEFTSIGFDVDKAKIAKLQRGECYISHVSGSEVSEWISSDAFQPTANVEDLSAADVILICVPTPLTVSRDPDLSYVRATIRQISKTLRPGQLICLESTTYPGTTSNVLVPGLERKGLLCGEDFFVAYSPEREDPGNRDWSTSQIPKVVGGADPRSGELAAALYQRIVQQVVVTSSAEVAEACKILENSYRAVNIALVNELKVLYDKMGINVWEVIEAAKTKPFGFQAFYPGPGLGGHCIPIDPFYLSWTARQHGMTTRFIELAGEINAGMPEYVVSQLTKALNAQSKSVRGSRVAVIGVAYKPDIDDDRESPSYRLMELLSDLGAEVSYNDPHIARLKRVRKHDFSHLHSQPITAEYLASQDCVLLATHHSEYDMDFIVQHASLLIDTRNATRDVVGSGGEIVKA